MLYSHFSIKLDCRGQQGQFQGVLPENATWPSPVFTTSRRTTTSTHPYTLALANCALAAGPGESKTGISIPLSHANGPVEHASAEPCYQIRASPAKPGPGTNGPCPQHKRCKAPLATPSNNYYWHRATTYPPRTDSRSQPNLDGNATLAPFHN